MKTPVKTLRKWRVPSGKPANITMFNGKINHTWPFSIAMLDYQMVDLFFCWENLHRRLSGFSDWNMIFPAKMKTNRWHGGMGMSPKVTHAIHIFGISTCKHITYLVANKTQKKTRETVCLPSGYLAREIQTRVKIHQNTIDQQSWQGLKHTHTNKRCSFHS